MRSEMMVTARNNGSGARFEGEVTIGRRTFSYVTEFLKPLGEYMTWARELKVAELRQVIPISVVTGEGEALQLTDDEWTIFYYAVVPSALKIHNTRAHTARSPTMKAAESGSLLVEASIIYLTEETSRLLMQPKFGCLLIDHSPLAGKPN